MEEQRLRYLLQQHLSGTATAQELGELSDSMQSDTDSERCKTLLAEMMQQEIPAFPADWDPYRQMEQQILAIDRHSLEPALTPAPARVRILRIVRWSAAAAILLLLGLGGYFWTGHRTQLAVIESIRQDSIISTARGEQRELILPDGTHVWLNAASSISFPANFAAHERVVTLSGEAFFDVKHADKTPFIIHSGPITTTVLGTAFDITAYPQQKNIRVAVQSGKVKVQTGNNATAAVLEKGRQVRISADTNTRQSDIDPLSIAAWRTGDLVYKDEMMEDIIADLQRAFKDSIEIRSPALKTIRITISFTRKDGLQNALEMISRTTDGRLSNKNGIFMIE